MRRNSHIPLHSLMQNRCRLGTFVSLLLVSASLCAQVPASTGTPLKKGPTLNMSRSVNLPENSLSRKMKQLMIPSLVVEEMPVNKVFEMLRQQSIKADPEKSGVNIIMQVPAAKLNRLITADCKDLSMEDALRYLCQVCSFDFMVEDYAVKVFEKRRN